MSASTYVVASASDVVQVWDLQDGVLGSGSADGTVAFSSISDGKCVKRLPSEEEARSALESASPLAPVAAFVCSAGSRYVCSTGGALDPSSTRYGLSPPSSAGASSVVTLWDLKKHVKTRWLTGHSAAITALDFGAGDQHVASCSMAGEILVHDVSNSTLRCRMTSAAAVAAGGIGGSGSGVALRDVQHSLHKKHVLASVGDSGVVEMWDCNLGTSLYTMRLSSSTATSLAPASHSALRFSPTSSSLLASAGLNKRLCFFDADSRRCIRDVATDYALTSLDYHADGCSIVLGTTAGHLLVYDIRSADRPKLKLLNAHAGRAVNAVKWAHASVPVNFGIGGGGGSNKSSPASLYDTRTSTFTSDSPAYAQQHQHPSQPSSQPQPHPNVTAPLNHSTLSSTALGQQQQQHHAHNHTVPVGYAGGGGGGGASDLFSPIKDAGAGVGTTVPTGASTSSSATSLHSPYHHPSSSSARGAAPSSSLGFLSPIGSGGGYADASTVALSPVVTMGSAGGLTGRHGAPTATSLAQGQIQGKAAGPGAAPSHLTSSSSSTLSAASRPSHLVTASPKHGARASTGLDSSEPNFAAPLGAHPSHSHTHTAPLTMQHTLPSPSSAPSSWHTAALPHSAAASPAHVAAASTAAAAASSSSHGGGIAPPGAGFPDSHALLLRSVLDESLHSLRSEMRGQLSELHVEMLKQFHAQQQEQARAMDAFASRFEQLVGEVKALREDYQQLRHIY